MIHHTSEKKKKNKSIHLDRYSGRFISFSLLLSTRGRINTSKYTTRETRRDETFHMLGVLAFFLSILLVGCDAFFVARPVSVLFRLFSGTGDLPFAASPVGFSFIDKGSSYSSEVLQAAASITRDSCPLLGVKSVGVDYGLVRTGVAATVGYNPTPLEIISDLNNTGVCERVVEICRAEQARQVIVGLPLHKNGTEAEQTTLTRIFAGELAHKVLYELGPECPVFMWDERYTSKEAAARAHSKNPGSFLYGTIDAEAACIILENFYDDSGEGAERVPVSDEALRKYEQIREQQIKREEEMAQAAVELRSSRLQWRKEAMERDRLLEATGESGSGTSTRKKKKKKRPRKL
jgi:putative Holliday junction resolvase